MACIVIRAIGGLLLATLTASTANVANADTLVIENVNLVDVIRGEVRPNRTVRVDDGRIIDVDAAIDREVVATVLDGRSRFLIPGLTDSHVHVDLVPGFGLARSPRNDAEKALVESYVEQLPRSYLYHGVTQLVDLAGSPRHRMTFDQQPVHPDLYHCGAVPLTAGYPSLLMNDAGAAEFLPYRVAPDGRPALADTAEIGVTPAALVERIADEGAICVKLFMEDGFGAASDWPMMGDALVDEIISQARRADLKIVVHANALDMQQSALDHDIDVLAHGLWNWGGRGNEETMPNVVENHLGQIAERDIGFQPTFGVMQSIAGLFDTKLLATDAMRAVTPRPLLDWYASDAGGWFRDELIADEGFEDMPFEAIRRILASVEARGARAAGYLDSLDHDLLVGSDTPSSPTYVNQPGLGTLREMQAMADAGVSPVNVLRAATINNARAFGLSTEHGSIESGKIANLVLLEQNPLESMSSYDTISTVIVHGEVFDRASLQANP